MAGGKRKNRRAVEPAAAPIVRDAPGPVAAPEVPVEAAPAVVEPPSPVLHPVADVTVYPPRAAPPAPDAVVEPPPPPPAAVALPEALASLAAPAVAPAKVKDEILWLTPYRSPDEACGRPTGEPLTADERADVIARLRLQGSGNAVRPELIGEIQRRQRGYLVVIRQQTFAVVGW